MNELQFKALLKVHLLQQRKENKLLVAELKTRCALLQNIILILMFSQIVLFLLMLVKS